MTEMRIEQIVVDDRAGRELSIRRELAHINRVPTMAGKLIVFGFLGSFALWGSVMPLAGGAVAKGTISPDGSRRTVQHREGGIIANLLVQDGDKVTAGQELVLLEDVELRARRDMQRWQHLTLAATRLRLEAEKANASTLVFPGELGQGIAGADSVLTSQEKLFNARITQHRAQHDVLQQRVYQLEKQINGFEKQLASTTRQLEFIEDELRDKRKLLEKGLMRKPEYLRLERSKADLLGRSGEYSAQIARAYVQISETRMQLLSLDADRINAIAAELAKINTEISTVEEQLRASEDALHRTSVTAPVTGTVANLHFKTLGGVIKAAEPILDIVPSEEQLIIEARLSPTDVDVVHKGLKAEVSLTAFPSRTTPRLSGELVFVAADSTLDARGQPYYAARVKVNPQQLADIRPRIELVPGMPADVLIITEERTMVEYLFDPMIEILRKSFREQ